MIKTRKALIVGIADYLDRPLENPVNDAKDMAKILEDKGFEVALKLNLCSYDFFKAIRDFSDVCESFTGTVLFYFAGHGVETEGVNYLLPAGEFTTR